MNAHEDHRESHNLASAAVVVGTDGSEGANLAVRRAAHLAAQRGRRLLIVHGYDIDATRSIRNTFDAMNPGVQDGLRRQGDALVANAYRIAAEEEPELTIATEVSSDSAAGVLINHSRSAHIMVIGATGKRGPSAHFGSTLLSVTSHGHGAVVVVHETDSETRSTQPVVVGVDGSALSGAAVGAAFAEASERGTGLVAVHCWSDLDEAVFYGAGIIVPAGRSANSEEALVAEQLAGWQEKYPDVTVARKVELAGPAKALTKYSKLAQLLVVGSRGRGGFSGLLRFSGLLLGSTSNTLVQHAHCPIMVVHPD